MYCNCSKSTYEVHLSYIMDRSVFWALFGAIYLCFGMPEVYRVLFEVFGMDPDAEECQPKLRRQLEDVDYVSAEFENKKLSWQDIAVYKVNLILFFWFHMHVQISKYCYISAQYDPMTVKNTIANYRGFWTQIFVFSSRGMIDSFEF